MRLLSRLRLACRGLRRPDPDRELQDEISSVEALLADEAEARGVPKQEARRQARLELGSPLGVADAVRDLRRLAGPAAFGRDLARQGRTLLRSPGLLAVLLLSLGLGIGANTALFSVAHAVLLSPLPYADPERLFILWSDLDRTGYRRAPLSGPELLDFRREAALFESFGAIWSTSGALTGDGEPEQIKLGLVTANFFDVLGVRAVLGRTFEAAEEGPTEAPSVVISHGLWTRRFGSDPRVLGRAVRLGGRTATVVGVLPAAFSPVFAADANVPADLEAFSPFDSRLEGEPRALYYLRTVGRSRSGVSPAQAAAEIRAVSSRIVPRHAEYAGSGRSFYVHALHADAVQESRPVLVALLAGVALLLLAACVNLAHLLVARALLRRRETALRLALGARVVDLVREQLALGLLLAMVGGGLSLLLARLGLALFPAFRPVELLRAETARLDLPVLGFTAALSLGAGILLSLLPLREALRVDLRGLVAGSSRMTGRLGRSTRTLLVASQIAVGVVLLAGAGLLLRTFARLAAVDPGYESEGVLTFRLSLPPTRYPTPSAVAAFHRDLEGRLQGLPGVLAVGAASHVPLDTVPNWSTPYAHAGIAHEGKGSREADLRAVSPGFFRTLEARLVEGRDFEEGDDFSRPKVVVVDELFARRNWPGRSALGQTIEVEFVKGGEFVPTQAQIVGVVRHLRTRSLLGEVREQVWEPQRQSTRDPMAYHVRSRLAPEALLPAVRKVVGALDPELPLYDVTPLEAYLSSALAGRRLAAALGLAFALIALLLAAVGTYGVVACAVGEREQEIGIRRALGASARDVLALVLRDGMAPVALGLGVGTLLSLALSPRLEALLYETPPRDPATLITVGVLLIGTALLACVLPARRALGRSPLDLLRIG